jgi:hypothetical protein
MYTEFFTEIARSSTQLHVCVYRMMPNTTICAIPHGSRKKNQGYRESGIYEADKQDFEEF